MERESLAYEVVIVGGGPSGLAAAIRLKQLGWEHGCELSVCVLEKGSEIGAHILSGAVIEPRALDELIPDWRERGAPLDTPVTEDRFLFLSSTKAYALPVPRQMRNPGNYVVSLGNVCRWLAGQAEALGVDIYPGFAVAEVIYREDGSVKGVVTGDMGLTAEGAPGPNYQAGIELHAKQTLFAEGCRGSLTKSLIKRFDLGKGAQPQTYGLGIKELWQIQPQHHHAGRVIHTLGWPLDSGTYGGAFLYHMKDSQLAVGFVVGLDYTNPYLSPFEEMQRFKLHPAIRPTFAGGRRVNYGARALVEGGYQSLPRLTFPGGMLIGDAAGFLNVPKIKGSHMAMKSGMTAAQAVFEALHKAGEAPPEVETYPERLRQCWLWDELYRARNIRPSFRWGLWPALAYSAVDTYLFRGRAPWTLANRADHTRLKPKDRVRRIDYPKPDGEVSFDRLSSVYLSNTHHAEDQPCHLKLRDATKAIDVNLVRFDAPERYYCPAGVYEIVEDEGGRPRLQINASNCVHCKACDIKDPTQNIDWVVPQGGDGPTYPNM